MSNHTSLRPSARRNVRNIVKPITASLALAAISLAIFKSVHYRDRTATNRHALEYTFRSLVDLALHLGCVWAVRWGAEMGLKRYITAQTLTPPSPSDPATPAPGPPKAPLKGWRKRWDTIKSILFALIPLTPALGLHLLEKYLRVRWVIDLVNVGFQVVWMSMVTSYALHTLANPSPQLKLVPSTVRRGYKLSDSIKDSRWLDITAVGLVSGVLLAGYMGYPGATGVIAIGWVAAMIPSFALTGLQVKWMVMVFFGVMAVVPLLVFTLRALWAASKSESEDPMDGEKKSIMLPAEWIMDTMTSFIIFPYYIFAGIFIALGLRYDYTDPSHPSARLAIPAAPGEWQTVPGSTTPYFQIEQPDGRLTTRPKTAYNAGITATLIYVLVLKVGVAMGGVQTLGEILGEDKSSPDFLIFGLPGVVCLSIMLAVWVKGDLKGWWEYSERWVPKAPEADSLQDVNDVEKTLWEDKASERPDQVEEKTNEKATDRTRFADEHES